MTKHQNKINIDHQTLYDSPRQILCALAPGKRPEVRRTPPPLDGPCPMNLDRCIASPCQGDTACRNDQEVRAIMSKLDGHARIPELANVSGMPDVVGRGTTNPTKEKYRGVQETCYDMTLWRYVRLDTLKGEWWRHRHTPCYNKQSESCPAGD